MEKVKAEIKKPKDSALLNYYEKEEINEICWMAKETKKKHTECNRPNRCCGAVLEKWAEVKRKWEKIRKLPTFL